ncbi:MAG: sulfate adenylyltransferase, large subunit [Thermoleophilia bacterium]|nr:sulfate adenylyltransferase, large subunit [Thermoleophilia bacterium]
MARQAAAPPHDPAQAPTRLLRIATAGSVDDGKSTLIGRLLHDSRSIFVDQLAQVELASQRRHGASGAVDLALLTDGLRAEREQGITIDVAYRYFATPRRSFIIADTPGHVSYTRNMVTGASTADLAVVLVDARHGIVEQSRRHACISALLGIGHVVLAVNKLDLVGFDEGVFRDIVRTFGALADQLGIDHVQAVPLCALDGDNVVDRSARMPWYDGPTLLEHLEAVDVTAARGPEDAAAARLPVQWVVRPGAADPHADYRGYAGQVARGVLRPGDEVVVLPAGTRTSIASIDTWSTTLAAAGTGEAVTVRLADDVDVARGDVIAAVSDPPRVTRTLEAMLSWMHERPLRVDARYRFQHATHAGRLTVTAVDHRIDIATLAIDRSVDTLELNELGHVHLEAAAPIAWDPYADNRALGSLILIDEATGATVAAGMLLAVDQPESLEADLATLARVPAAHSRAERSALLGLRGATVWLADADRAYAQVLASLLVRSLVERGVPATLLAPADPVVAIDGAPLDAASVMSRLAEAARLLGDAGVVAVVVAGGAAGALPPTFARDVHDDADVTFLDVTAVPRTAPPGADLVLDAPAPGDQLALVLALLRDAGVLTA